MEGSSGGARGRLEDRAGDGERELEGEGVRDGNGEPNGSTWMFSETLCSKSKVASRE